METFKTLYRRFFPKPPEAVAFIYTIKRTDESQNLAYVVFTDKGDAESDRIFYRANPAVLPHQLVSRVCLIVGDSFALKVHTTLKVGA